MIDKLLKRFSFAGVVVSIMMGLAASPGVTYAQQDGESRYEKLQKEKIKRNRKRIKKSERAFSNKRQLRTIQYQTGSRQGDRPYSGKFNRSKRGRISSSSTPAVYAQPDPYSFRPKRERKRNIYANDDLKLSPKPPARAWQKRSQRIVTPRSEAPKISVYPQPDPYSYRKKRTDRDRISKRQGSFGTSPRDPESAAGRPPAKINNRSAGRINVYPRANPYSYRKLRSERDRISRTQSTFGTSPRDPESASRRAPAKYNNRSVGRINTFPSRDPYSNRRFRSEGERVSDNQNSYATSPRATERPPKKKRIRISSASGRYIVTRRAKPYKLRDRKKWEETYTGGFYGRRSDIRPKNTQRVSVSGSRDPYAQRGRLGDKPYSGEITGGYKSQPKQTQRAWKGDIAGRKLRSATADRGRINVFPGVDPYSNRKNRSEGDRMSRDQDFYGSNPRNTQRPSSGRRIKINSATRGYIVRRKAKPYKIRDVKKWEEVYTGGFYSRREGIDPKNTQRVSSFESPDPYRKRGRLGDKPYKGMTGGFSTEPREGQRAWKGDIAGRKIDYSRPRDNQRGGRALKTTAGSVSGTMARNNEGEPIRSFIPGNTGLKATVFKGNRDMFEVHPGFNDDYLNFQGTAKARRPDKGGGSIARADWNNSGRSLPQRFGDKDSRMAGSFNGSLKASKPLKGGGSVSADRWNNNGERLPQRYGDKNSRVAGSFGGTIKTSRPDKGGGSISRGEGWNNDGSALARKYSAGKWSGFAGNTKQKDDYTKNKRAADNAIKVREPDQSYFAAGNFTGNMKRSRGKPDGQVHTGTKFHNAKAEKNAVEEKKKIFSFKILWNRMFGKNTPEPDKERKPRYDKGEKGLWNE